MDNFQICQQLIKAETSEELKSILKKNNLWDDKKLWRYYGDQENNAGTINAQQSEPVKAFVEKITNSIDAVLVLECIKNGIDPQNWDKTPRTVREAVSKFITKKDIDKNIYVYAEGHLKPKNPTICIYDDGEGQHPSKVPETFLSLGKSNKNKIQFLQGQYNMGGAGVLRFCGTEGLQLLITKRNPSLLENKEKNLWSFTVIRKESPDAKLRERNPFYTFLAPIGANEKEMFRKGDVLSFEKDELKLIPKQNNNYQISKKSGTLIKCYDYQIKNKSNILLPGGFLNHVEAMMPDCAMPSRFVECRKFKGNPQASYENSMVGYIQRFKNRGDAVYKDTLEKNFPINRVVSLGDNKIPIQIFAFKRYEKSKNRTVAENRRLDNEGIVFTLNGQHYYHLPYSFFSTKRVKLPTIAKDIIAVADFSKIDNDLRVSLFMSNKENMAKNQDYNDLIQQFENVFKNCEELKILQSKRKEEESRAQVENDKSLDEIFSQLLVSNPALAELFGSGTRLSSAFNLQPASEQNEDQKNLLEFPTYFKFEKIDYGEILKRTGVQGKNINLKFITDAKDDYFLREEKSGNLDVSFSNEKLKDYKIKYSDRLKNGACTVSISFPELLNINEILSIDVSVQDETQEKPFKNTTQITVIEPKDDVDEPPKPPRPPNPPKPPKPGEKKEVPGGLNLPEAIEVRKEQYNDYSFEPFDEFDALEVAYQGEQEDDKKNKVDLYKYYVNMDNFYLLNELKRTKIDIEVVKTRFKMAMVFLGVSMLAQLKIDKLDDDIEEATKKVRFAARSISRVILPVIHVLGSLETLPETEE